jgi:tetratricopeptide (TPR) repeat protein
MNRRMTIGLGATVSAAALATGVAWAEDKPLYQPVPAWVKPAAQSASITPPAAGSEPPPVTLLLTDQQVVLEPGAITTYSQIAMRIGTPQGLSAGNISLPWRPDTDTLIIHRLAIRRGDKTIDVLAAGQTFTVVRRETNLESATLDGVLTANIQPEGLQVGDIVDFAMSIVSRDPVMKQNVEYVGATWNALPITRAHLRVQWPSSMTVRFNAVSGLPAVQPVKANGSTTIDFSLDDVVPLVLPKGAPTRFQIGRMLEVSTFTTWSDVAALLAPLYAQTAVLPADGPLVAEVERIRAGSVDPKVRTEAALSLVQDRIRYVALAMGTGGLVPADTKTTWSRRFGDCKGKTVMLVAILRSLGITAEAVAVSSGLGDGMDTRLPRVSAFDHVLVRATIGGTVYWLDGTRTGDVSLDRLTVPAFGWGLPLVSKNAALVRMIPAPLDRPQTDVAIRINATGGLMTPAPIEIETVMRGDAAIALGAAIAGLTGDARDRAMRDYWKGQYDFVDVASTATDFDPKSGERRLSMKGKARMDWTSGWYETDGMGIGYRADFARDVGLNRNAPFAVPYPYNLRTVETILLPPGFPEQKPEGKNDIALTVAGIEYHRRVTLKGGVFTAERTERSLAAEFPAKDAPAAQATLRDLADQTLYIRRPASYRVTDNDLAVWQAKTLTSDGAYIDRGNALLDRGRHGEAIKDFDAALAIDPKDVTALADRGVAKVWMQDYVGAARDLQAAETLDPRNAIVWRGRALQAEMTDDLKSARAAYARALEIDPGSSFALNGRARMARSLGDPDAALTDLAAIIALEPTNADTYLVRANIQRASGKPEAVAAEAAALIKAAPDNSYVHVVAARIYQSLGRRDDALREFDRALAIKPAAYIYLNRIDSRPKTDRTGKMADLTLAAKLEPQSPDVLAKKADLLVEDDKFIEAITLYDAQLAKTPADVRLLLARGFAKIRAGDTKGSAVDLATAGSQSKSAPQFNNLCWTKAVAGLALESALADCNRALTLSPKTAAFLDSKGMVLLRLGRTDEAIVAYDQALAIRPDIAGSYYGRGIAWKRKADPARADADVAAARKIDAGIIEEFAGYGVTS